MDTLANSFDSIALVHMPCAVDFNTSTLPLREALSTIGDLSQKAFFSAAQEALETLHTGDLRLSGSRLVTCSRVVIISLEQAMYLS